MKELLVPVGNMDTLKIAIHSGADAVYLGGKKFGARAYASNFDDEEMIQAIKICHLYGVKIYVTVNTLIHEGEMYDVLEYVKFLHKNNVDAIIVQDIGLINLVHNILPNLEIHISTQGHNTNESTFEFYKKLGVKRVVLARELSIDEIDDISTDLEKEAFIHGALCISYSGQCLFSSVVMNRSGNRGECAQICRLPFKLKENDNVVSTDGEYLLSTRELNTVNEFKRIMDSSIYSLKIEGRMKSPEYVGCVTRLYRDLLDKYYNNEKLVVNKEYLNDLEVIFNREYTKGFINHANNMELMNIKTSNHLGVRIGKVIDVNKKYITIKLDGNISQGDGIRFMSSNEGMILNYLFNENELLINSNNGNIIKVLNKCTTKVGDIVNKTLDINIKNKYLTITPKRIKISMILDAYINKPIKLTVSDSNNSVCVEGNKVESSINRPLSDDDIKSKLSKINDTVYELDDIIINKDDNIFIPVSVLNSLRRDALSLLDSKRIGNSNYVELDYSDIPFNNRSNDIKFNILVRNENQLKYLLDKNVTIIISDKLLYKKYEDYNNIYYRTNRVKDTFIPDRVSVSEIGALNKASGSLSEYYLNICNHYTINTLKDYLDVFQLSIELNDDEISSIMKYYNNSINTEILIYGRIELMLLKYCPLNLLVNKNNICTVCSNNNRYYLVDRNNYNYPIGQDIHEHTTHILDHRLTNKLDLIDKYISYGINNFRIELLDENIEDINKILERVDLYK
jgi:putative protease